MPSFFNYRSFEEEIKEEGFEETNKEIQDTVNVVLKIFIEYLLILKIFIF